MKFLLFDSQSLFHDAPRHTLLEMLVMCLTNHWRGPEPKVGTTETGRKRDASVEGCFRQHFWKEKRRKGHDGAETLGWTNSFFEY